MVDVGGIKEVPDTLKYLLWVYVGLSKKEFF
jgi:hypothetical protein